MTHLRLIPALAVLIVLSGCNDRCCPPATDGPGTASAPPSNTSTASAPDPTGPLPKGEVDKDGFRTTFKMDEKNLSSVGRNKYFVLYPGYELVLEGKEDGEATRLTVTVLNETKKIGNIETRVVVEHEVAIATGKVKESSRNYFAIDKTTHDVYYFGEDVGGAWTHGVDGARYGLMMPGAVKVGDKYYEEVAKNAQDRSENQSDSETVTTPAGTFNHCLKVEETTPLEPKTKEHKWYAPDVGLCKEGDLVLVKHGMKK